MALLSSKRVAPGTRRVATRLLSREGWRWPWRLVALALFVSSCCAGAPDSSVVAGAPAAAASASSAGLPATSAAGWVGVPQRQPRGGEFFFHPSLPLAGQDRGQGRCAVWDLDVGLLRGDVDLRACRAWHPPPAQVPRALVARTPDVAGASSPAALVSAGRADGRRVALGREGGRQVQLWDPATLAPLHRLELPSTTPGGATSDEPPRLVALAWTDAGELAVAGFPFGALLWSPEASTPSVRPLKGDFHPFTALSLDPAGRYLGYGAQERGQRGDTFHYAGVRSLTSDRELVTGQHSESGSPELAIEAPAALPLGWSAAGHVGYGVRQGEFDVARCDLQGVELDLLDVRDHLHSSINILLGEHLRLGPSPEGAYAAWVVKTWEQCPGESRNVPSATAMHLVRWTPTGQTTVAWSVPTTADAIAWAPGSTSVAAAAEARVTVYDVATGKVKAQWAGSAPLAWSPAGDQLVFADPTGVLMVRRLGAGGSRRVVAGARSVAWAPDGTLAVATEAAVTFFATGPWRPVRSLALPGVVTLTSDTPHGRWLLTDAQHTVHVDDPGATERLTTTVPQATVHPTAAGEVVVVEPSRLRRFGRAASGWVEQPAVPLQERESVDPSGRVAVTLREGLARVRRLADGEVLNVGGRVAWTDRYAHDGQPGRALEPWVFRSGDVLKGRMVRGAEASALASHVPDLWAAFWSGAALPGL